MNGAYETNTPAHVHWHVDPRYKKTVKFLGLEFKDTTYGNLPDYKRINMLPKETLELIIKEIKKYLK
jgi:diadenosine tetraphosphate (Ap4A) HIT family hydrolase